MGSYWLHLKNRLKAQFITIFFSLQIMFYNTDLYSNIDKQTRLWLGTFEYIEADIEIYRQWIIKSKQYSTFHVWVSDYFTCSIIICRSLCITLRYVTLLKSQNLTKEKNYVCYLEITMGSIWPQAEININKKINGKRQKLENVVTSLGRPYEKKYEY
jgi:Na+/phosphate symporter